MADLHEALRHTWPLEGGYQNYKGDLGNWYRGKLIGTNLGITPATYKRAFQEEPTVEKMKALTKDQAAFAYEVCFWDQMYGDLHPDQQLANILFDGIIQHGIGVLLMQEAVNKYRTIDIDEDNIYGPQTHAALTEINPIEMFYLYKDRRREYYYKLLEKVHYQKFASGWIRRINSWHYDCNSAIT